MKDIKELKFIIFSNNERGIKVINELKKYNCNIVSIICTQNKLNLFNKENLGIEIIFENNINSNDFINKMLALKPNIFIVAGFPQIFSKELISIPNMGILNLHAGRLPQYRGGSPLNWQIINGEQYAGISVILMGEGIDTGNILAKEKIGINDSENIEHLQNKANSLFPKITIEALKKLLNNNSGIKQLERDAIYWHQRKDEDGRINFSIMKSNEVDRLIRALFPKYKPAWAIFNQNKLRITNISIPKKRIKGIPGRVLFLQGEGPYIICKEAAILVKDYYFENDKELKLTHGMQIN